VRLPQIIPAIKLVLNRSAREKTRKNAKKRKSLLKTFSFFALFSVYSRAKFPEIFKP
jgi:hypothetical protein